MLVKIHLNKLKFYVNQLKRDLRKKFITSSAYIRKVERSQINDLSFDLKKLDNKEQIKAKVNGRNKMRKSRNQ